MTPHQILIVGIRLLVIFWLFVILGQFAAAVASFERMGGAIAPIWIWSIIQFMVCVFLWLFPATLASRLLKSGDSPVSVTSTSFDEWRDLLFVTVGIFVLARAIPSVLYFVILASVSGPIEPAFTLEQKVNAFAGVVELLIGVGLVFGAGGLAALIHRLRS